MSNIQQISREVIMNQLQSLTSTELLQLVTSQISKIERDHNERFTLQEVVNSNTEKQLGYLKELTMYNKQDEYKNLTNLGMDWQPQISDKAVSVILNYLGLTKYNTSEKRYIAEQHALNRNLAIEYWSNEINGKRWKNYKWHSKRILELLNKKLEKFKKLDEFNSHITSQERNYWIFKNLIP